MARAWPRGRAIAASARAKQWWRPRKAGRRAAAAPGAPPMSRAPRPGPILALIALTVAALTTLLVPVAVRRMIDFGFTPKASR